MVGVLGVWFRGSKRCCNAAVRRRNAVEVISRLKPRKKKPDA
jgi:hypothetical protein